MKNEYKKYMKKILNVLLPALTILVAGLMLIACGPIKQIPVETVEKGTYFSIKTKDVVRRNDKLFKIVPADELQK